jgi:hypothetical protein
MTDEEKKIKELELRIKKLEAVVSKIYSRLDYYERERQRMKSNVENIANVLRR